MEINDVTKNVTKKGVFMVNNVKVRLFRRGINSPSTDGKKSSKKSFTWSARFTDPITGVEGNPVAVSKLRKKIGSTDCTPIRTRDEALMICARAVELGVCFGSNYNPSFLEYCSEYWDYNKSQYVRDLLLEDSNSISENYCHNMQSLVLNHVSKYIPESRKLASIKRLDIEHLKRKMMEEGNLSAETMRKVLKSVGQPLGYAVRQSLISSNPSEGITIKTSGKTSERGCYSMEQVSELLKYLKSHQKESIENRRLWLAVELASKTGMRLGEIRALRSDRITFTFSDIGSQPCLIEISGSWAVRTGSKSTKGKRSRIAPVPEWLGHELVDFAKECPFKGNTLVFWGEKVDTPIGEHSLRDRLLDVLKSLGMETDEKGNALGFHSFRHFFNTFVRQFGILNDTQLRAIIGHQSEKMSDRYTHDDTDALIASGIKLEAFFKKMEA